jgi:hypothetical protein
MRSRLSGHSAPALSSPTGHRAERAQHHTAATRRGPAARAQQDHRAAAERASLPALLSPRLSAGFDQRTHQSLITRAPTLIIVPARTHHSALGDDPTDESLISAADLATLTGRRWSPTHHHGRPLPRSAPRGK